MPMIVLAGGLLLFLFGMRLLEEGFAGALGERLKYRLGRITDTPVRGLLAGAGVTAVLQSSSVTTATVVGLVDSGVLNLQQAATVIMGANVGTTITAWILGLFGIGNDLRIIPVSQWYVLFPLTALAGAGVRVIWKRRKAFAWINVIMGFLFLFFGIHTMGEAARYLVHGTGNSISFNCMEDPFRGFLAGLILTGILQSSSASVGILQALCVTKAVSLQMAVPFIMGQNVGTCVTALLAGAGSGINGKRAALVHLYFNLIAGGVFLPLFCIMKRCLPEMLLTGSVDSVGIALVHSLFNVGGVMLLYPNRGRLVKLACLTVGPDASAYSKTQPL